MRIDWEAFFPLVKQHCEQVPDPVLLSAVRAAAAEFCRETLAYRVDLDPLMVVAGTAEYELDPPDMETRIITPLFVSLDGNELVETCEDEMPRGWRTGNSGRPRSYLVMNAQALWLYPAPSEDSATGLFVRAAVKPTTGSTGAEDFLLEDHGETIAHGAVARILEIPQKAWSDAQLSVYHAGKFRDGLAVTKLRSRKGNTTADLRVTPRAFL